MISVTKYGIELVSSKVEPYGNQIRGDQCIAKAEDEDCCTCGNV